MSVAPLITQGFGLSRQRILTKGFNPDEEPTPAIEDVIIRGGRSSIKKRDRCDEYLITACLLEVNKSLHSGVPMSRLFKVLKESEIRIGAKKTEISHSKSKIYEIFIDRLKINEE